MSLSPLSDEDIQYVCTLAKEAGKLAAELRSHVAIKCKSGPDDMVTDADCRLSELILERLKQRFPSDLLISEEDKDSELPVSQYDEKNERVWLIDPIDGTDNYINNNGQYSVMIGLLLKGQPVFGCVYSPAADTTYYGGPAYGALRKDKNGIFKYASVSAEKQSHPTRLIIGSRDKNTNPWIKELKDIEWLSLGSVGLKVAKVLENEADLYIHLSGKLKLWDTVAPCAIALAGGLETGSLNVDNLQYPLPKLKHETSVIIGKPGSLNWSRQLFMRAN